MSEVLDACRAALPGLAWVELATGSVRALAPGCALLVYSDGRYAEVNTPGDRMGCKAGSAAAALRELATGLQYPLLLRADYWSPVGKALADMLDAAERAARWADSGGLGVSCEGCPTVEATTRDSNGVPLCDACYDALEAADG